MDFRGRKTSFQEADLRYAELKQQHDAGIIGYEEFDAQLRHLMVQDDDGRWWAKSRETGEWNYHDGRAWVRGAPLGYQPSPAIASKSELENRPQVEQGEQSLSPQTPLSGAPPVQDHQNGEKRRKGVPRGVAAGAGLLAVVLIVVGISFWLLVPAVSDGIWLSSEKSSGPASGFAMFEHDSRALSVEVPSEWTERIIIDTEGEKGRTSWSSFLDDESAGPSMTAVNDLYSWRNGTPGHQGIYAVASKNLAQRYTDEELVALGPNDYSSACEAGTTQDFDRPPYSGKMLEWKNCGGDSNHMAITLAAAPKGRECVVVAQIGGYFETQTDEENIQHILNTLEANCNRIN